MNQYFPKLCISFRDINLELDLSNSVRKADTKEKQVLVHHRL